MKKLENKITLTIEIKICQTRIVRKEKASWQIFVTAEKIC